MHISPTTAKQSLPHGDPIKVSRYSEAVDPYHSYRNLWSLHLVSYGAEFATARQGVTNVH